jgi:para-nitrobenzyl esterase
MTPRSQAWFGCRQLVVGLIVAAAAVPVWAGSAAAQPTVVTDKGSVVGFDAPTVHKFLGIPYAAPPVGDLRWQPPQSHAAWLTPIDASAFANHCPQVFTPFGRESDTEDCLYLNVYTPNHKGFAKDVRHRKPVMVWIHGGALVTGESDDYDPTTLVEKGDVVVVTINYRLGALGFLAHPALTAESPDHASGNYGLMDQQLALRWVQSNIRAFGGNPRRVTIFGESAGGLSVHSQLGSPLAAGLFQRAIVQSGAYLLTQPTLADGETRGSAFATLVGCSDQSAACLRAVPVDQIVANQGNTETSTTPVIDGKVFTEPLKTAFSSGRFNRVPIMEGSNHDEYRLFVGLQEVINGGPLTDAEYPDAIAALLQVPPTLVPLFVGAYPITGPGAYPSPSVALGALATDAAFACNARTVSRSFSFFVPTFAYEFNDENAPELFLPPVSFPYGAAHASEIQYLFSPDGAPFPTPLDADQQVLADMMVHYWTRFARSGKPKVPRMPVWPRYSLLKGEAVFSLVPPPQTPAGESGFARDHKCSFWASLL